MKDVRVRNNKGKLDLQPRILLAGLALVVIVGLVAWAQPASNNMDGKTDELLFGRMKLLNPFTLTTINVPLSRSNTVVFSDLKTLVAQRRPGEVILRGLKPGFPILIPIRQAVRTPFRQPW